MTSTSATPLARTRYLMVQHAGTFKLMCLTDTGTHLTLQTPQREAEGRSPRVFCAYFDNNLPPDLNASVCISLLGLRYMPKVDQVVAAKLYTRDMLNRSRALIEQSQRADPPNRPVKPAKMNAAAQRDLFNSSGEQLASRTGSISTPVLESVWAQSIVKKGTKPS